MKLLVLSNVSGSVDRVVDLLNSNNVVAKETSTPMSGIAKTAGEQLRNGGYDMVIVVAKNPIGAGMLLNKQDGVEAAVCGSVDDALQAKENGANVIVIRDIDSDELHDILAASLGHGSIMGRMKLEVKVPEIKVPQIPKVDLKMQKGAAEERRPAKIMKKPRQAAEEEEEIKGSDGMTLIGKIKDYLGIM